MGYTVIFLLPLFVFHIQDFSAKSKEVFYVIKQDCIFSAFLKNTIKWYNYNSFQNYLYLKRRVLSYALFV